MELFVLSYLRGKNIFNKFLEDCKGNSDKMMIENEDKLFHL